jgi:hypothetical protein
MAIAWSIFASPINGSSSASDGSRVGARALSDREIREKAGHRVNYPKVIKAFYMRVSDDGSQREERLEVLDQRHGRAHPRLRHRPRQRARRNPLPANSGKRAVLRRIAPALILLLHRPICFRCTKPPRGRSRKPEYDVKKRKQAHCDPTRRFIAG